MSSVRIFTENIVDSSLVTAITASSAAGAYPVTNIEAGLRRSRVWRSTGCAAEWVKIDAGTSVNPLAAALIGPRNGGVQLTAAATVKIQGNATDAWTSPTYEGTLAYHDNAMALTSATGLHTSALRYWRFTFADASNPLGYIEVGALLLGDFFVSTRGAVQFPLSGRYRDASVTVVTQNGETISDVREHGEEYELDWYGLTIAEKEELEAFWERVGTTTAFFVQLDPDGVFSSNALHYVRYVKFSGEPRWELSAPGVFGMQMSLREEV